MAQWNFSGLQAACKEKDLPDPTEHLVALSWRWKRGDYHADMANQVWAELWDQSFNTADAVFREHVFGYTAHVEACICCLHALGDLAVQVVNDVALDPPMDERDVSLWLVVDRLHSVQAAADVETCARTLKDSADFRYVSDFCNTLKHRLLIPTDIHGEFGGEYRNELGIRFGPFEHNGRPWGTTWGSDILGSKRAKIAELVVSIGQSLDDYVAGLL